MVTGVYMGLNIWLTFDLLLKNHNLCIKTPGFRQGWNICAQRHKGFIKKCPNWFQFPTSFESRWLLLNILRPGDLYLRHCSESSLVKIMACRLHGVKPLPEPSWLIVSWAPRYKLQWSFNRNSSIFIEENAFEKVDCKMSAILSHLTPVC